VRAASTLLLSVDVRKIPMDDLMKDNRILLPITVIGRDNFIEIVPHKARAGYLSGYSDPEFIENLAHTLPLAFATGELSSPQWRFYAAHKSGFFIVGRYVEKLGDVMDSNLYIVDKKRRDCLQETEQKNGKKIQYASIRIIPI
jgi:hypothetical protein